MPSIYERREIAAKLRIDVPTECNLTDGELLDEITEIVMSQGSRFTSTEEYDAAFVNRLADLIDPTAHERTVADNLRIIDRNRELECELAQVKREVAGLKRELKMMDGHLD